MVRRLPLALLACAPFVLFAAGCSDSSNGGEPQTSGASTTAPVGGSATATASSSTNSGPAPVVAGPASKYSILLSDLGLNAFRTDIPATFTLTAKSYGATKLFPNPADGEKMLNGWGYIDGYETAMIPEGGSDSLLKGAILITLETHVFESNDGAEAAYAYIKQKLDDSAGATPKDGGPVGNENGYWLSVAGVIPNSSQKGVSYHAVFRRGNVVGIVKTTGAEPLMQVRSAQELAAVIDAKVLGTKDAIEPTPTSNYTPPAGSQPRTPNIPLVTATPTPRP